jgi:hypothetical protein
LWSDLQLAGDNDLKELDPDKEISFSSFPVERTGKKRRQCGKSGQDSVGTDKLSLDMDG